MDTTSLLQATPLAAGQRLHLAVDAGTVLVAVQGDLRVDEAPRWLADHWVPVGCWVGEGQAHRVAQAGWVCVTAQRDARLVQLTPVPLRLRVQAWLAQWAGSRQAGPAVPGKV